MPDTDQDQQPTKIEPVMPADGVPSLYANHIGLSATQSDVRIMFGELLDVQSDRVRVGQRVHVLVSWLQLKATARLLQDYVDMFEQNNGPITPPKLTAVVASNPFSKK
jgi:hypothetical protein